MHDWSTAARKAQASYYALLAASAPARACAVGSSFGVVTGIFSNTENGVVADAATPGEVETAIAWFQTLNARNMALRLARAHRSAVECGLQARSRRGGHGRRSPVAPPALAALRHRDRPVGNELGLGGHRPLVHHLALRGERPIGMATAFFTERTVLLQHVGVVETDRRRGVGRAIYRPLGFTTTPTGRDDVFYLPLQPAGT